MQQTMPVADLVHRRAPATIMRNRATGHRGRQDITSVVDVVLYRTRRVDFGIGKRAESQQIRRRRGVSRAYDSVGRRLGGGIARVDIGRIGQFEVGLEVDVETAVAAAAQGSFHLLVIAVPGPGIVDAPVDAEESVADACVGVCAFEKDKLVPPLELAEIK